MRHSVFLAVFVATFVTLCGRFTSAANAATTNEENTKSKSMIDFAMMTDNRAVSGVRKEPSEFQKRVKGDNKEERGIEMLRNVISKIRGRTRLERVPTIEKPLINPNLNAQAAQDVAKQVKKKPRSMWGKIFIALKLAAGVGFAAAVFGSIYGLGGMLMDYV